MCTKIGETLKLELEAQNTFQSVAVINKSVNSYNLS